MSASASASVIYPYPSQHCSITPASRPCKLQLDTTRQRAEFDAFQAKYSLSPGYYLVWDDKFATEGRLCHEAAIGTEVERTVVAQKRAKAKKAAQMAAILAYSSPTDIAAEKLPADYKPLSPERRAREPLGRMTTNKTSPGRPRTIDTINTSQFPRDNRPRDENMIVMQRSPPQSPAKRLSPLARFNPFVRTRADSMSSIIDDHSPSGGHSSDDERSDAKSWSKKLKRAATAENLFARIREAATVRIPPSSTECCGTDATLRTQRNCSLVFG